MSFPVDTYQKCSTLWRSEKRCASLFSPSGRTASAPGAPTWRLHCVRLEPRHYNPTAHKMEFPETSLTSILNVLRDGVVQNNSILSNGVEFDFFAEGMELRDYHWLVRGYVFRGYLGDIKIAYITLCNVNKDFCPLTHKAIGELQLSTSHCHRSSCTIR